MPKGYKPTNQQQCFVEHYCTDAAFNASLAYKMAYPLCKSGYNAHGARQIARDSIKQAISKFRAEIRKKTGFTVEDAHKLYEHAYDVAESAKQSGAMVGASTGIARLYGMDKDSGGGREQTVIIIGPKQPVKAIESVPVASDGLIEGERE